MLTRRLLLTVVLCFQCALACGEPRTWRDATGKFSVEAEFQGVKDDNVVLKKAGGETIVVPLKRLSAADRRHVASLSEPEPAQRAPAADEKISELMEQVLEKHDVPAIAGAIVSGDGLVAMGVAGVRKRGTRKPATTNDLWHLGSNTKAMTATLVARLVEKDRLAWDTTIGEVFSDSGFELHPDFQKVTMLHLLSHRAGLPANLNLPDYLGADAPAERLRAVRQELAKPPQHEPGTNFEYSNLGYIIVGAIVEKRTGKSWQQNMAEHVFRPLKMTRVGFGGTGTPGKLDQPWGHFATGKPVPLNGPAIDNPPLMGPAGRVHCTIVDWSKFVADILRGTSGKPALLAGDTYSTLFKPPFGGDYALGWIVTKRDWAGGRVLVHNGSNTMNYATVWIAPERDFALLACANQGGDTAQLACDAAVTALIGYHKEHSEE